MITYPVPTRTRLLSGLALIALSLATSPRVWGAQITIAFDSKDFPGKVRLYELQPKYRFSIAKTGSETDPTRLPVAAKRGNRFEIAPGGAHAFAMEIDNPTDEDWYFFASPHVAEPPQAALGHYFECLCMHHVFKVPRKSHWYRILRIELSAGYQSRKGTFRHTLVGVSEAEARTKYKDQLAE